MFRQRRSFAFVKGRMRGYSEFRLKLRQEVSSKEQKKINMDLTAVKDFFERVQTQAFAENIQEAVKLLTKASSIIFVGVGNSSIIGKYGARYFNNVGWFSLQLMIHLLRYFAEKVRGQLRLHCLYQERQSRH